MAAQKQFGCYVGLSLERRELEQKFQLLWKALEKSHTWHSCNPEKLQQDGRGVAKTAPTVSYLPVNPGGTFTKFKRLTEIQSLVKGWHESESEKRILLLLLGKKNWNHCVEGKNTQQWSGRLTSTKPRSIVYNFLATIDDFCVRLGGWYRSFLHWRKVLWLFRQERAFRLVLISWHAMDEIWMWRLFWVVLAYIYLIKKKNSLLPCIVTRYQHQPERPFLTKKSKNFPPMCLFCDPNTKHTFLQSSLLMCVKSYVKKSFSYRASSL